MIVVKVNGTDLTGALRALKKKLDKDGVLKAARAEHRVGFEKPSDRRRRKERATLARARKRAQQLS
jgi:ribosomal protein S21